MRRLGRLVKRLALIALAAAIVVGGVYVWRGYKEELLSGPKEAGGGGGGRPPATVATAKAVPRTWQPSIHATGTLDAVNGVAVAPEIAGVVDDVAFKAGQRVKEGDVLVRMRDAELRAQLRALKAERDEARSAFERDRRLYRQGNQSEAQLDQSRARFQRLKAQIDEQAARISKKTVRAPFAGQLGLREVDLGEYVSPGQMLVRLQSLAPLHAEFTVPEQRLPRLETGQEVEVRVDAYPDEVFTGEITAISPAVDVETRNVAVQATLANDGEKLRPGMFARVDVLLPAKRNVITLPQTAIVHQPYGDSVYVVQEPEQEGAPPTVSQRFIETGAERGTQIAVTEGLDGGETVVSAGQIKLRDGAPVRIDNDVQPANQATAQVQEP